jgi:membrane-associated phospholipid phosphatase
MEQKTNSPNIKQTLQKNNSNSGIDFEYALREINFWSTMRATPVIYNFYNILNVLAYPTSSNIYLASAYVINFYANDILKKGFKQLYNMLNTDYIPLLGRGSRPDGATNSGYFLKLNKPKALTFGMPSGHAQKSWFMTTYLSYKMIESNNNIYIKAFSISSMILLSSYVSSSRIHIEKCHTLNQVLWGQLIGMCMGYGTFLWEDTIVNNFNIILNKSIDTVANYI